MAGTGTIRPYKDGFRVSVSGGRDPQTGRRIQRTAVVRGGIMAAKAKRTELLSKLNNGEKVGKGGPTLADYIGNTWWPDKETSIAPWTRNSYRQKIDGRILPALGPKSLGAITSVDIRQTLRPIIAEGRMRTAEYVYVLLNMIFKDAMLEGLILRSPCLGVKRPVVEKKETDTLSPDDWERVKEALEAGRGTRNKDAPLIFSILVLSGLRRSEFCGLRWGDIDLDAGTITVRRAYHVIKREHIFRAPKSKRSRRVIDLDDETIGALRAWRVRAQELAAMFERKLSPSTPAFTFDGINPYAPDSISGLWARVRKELGLNVRLHDLRHTCVTLLLSLGVPVREVADRVGHADPGFTLRVYGHAVPGGQKRAANQLAGHLNGTTSA